MKTLTLLLIMTLTQTGLNAQNITGDWYAKLVVQGTPLHLVFHITKSGDSYISTMDSPDQGANGLATDHTTFMNNKLEIVAAKFGLSYSGTFNADSNIVAGTFSQSSMSMPLTLYRDKNAGSNTPSVEKAKRPQDPTDFPYKKEEISFQNPKANATLAGTLTIPPRKKLLK